MSSGKSLNSVLKSWCTILIKRHHSSTAQAVAINTHVEGIGNASAEENSEFGLNAGAIVFRAGSIL